MILDNIYSNDKITAQNKLITNGMLQLWGNNSEQVVSNKLNHDGGSFVKLFGTSQNIKYITTGEQGQILFLESFSTSNTYTLRHNRTKPPKGYSSILLPSFFGRKIGGKNGRKTRLLIYSGTRGKWSLIN